MSLPHTNLIRKLTRAKAQLSATCRSMLLRRPFPLQIPPYIAVTIGVGSNFSFMARHAAESCRWATGLPTFVVGEYALKRFCSCKYANQIKLHLFELFPEASTILYFDSDTLFLKRWDVRNYFNASHFVCVRDQENKWSRADSEITGVPLEEYYNSGFFIASRAAHAPMFERAQELLRRNFPTTLRDQGYLNRALYELSIPTQFLPSEYNSVAFKWRENVHLPTLAHFNGGGYLPRRSLEELYETMRPLREKRRRSWIDWKHCAYQVL